MTDARIDALALAVDILEDVDQGASDRGTSPERLAEVRELARFILGEDAPGGADADPAEDGAEEYPEPGPLGPLTEVHCSDTPSDLATVQGGRSAVHGAVVRLAVGTAQGGGMVLLTPADARRFAAGLLNAADEADGTAGLAFGTGSPQS
ncbi:hypothetical protein ACFWDN_21120 [Micromonospora chalcea]